MAYSRTTLNNIPVITPTPSGQAFDFINDLATVVGDHHGAIRYADDYDDSDYGAKVNSAIADLPANGGTVIMSAGEHEYSTGISIGTNSRVRLMGLGYWNTWNETYNAVTDLIYTGSSIPLDIGDGSTLTQGVWLENFRLEMPAISGPCIRIRNKVARSVIKHVFLSGTSQTGTGIVFDSDGVSGSSNTWHVEDLNIYGFDLGADINDIHNSKFIGGKFNGCNTGIRIGNSVSPAAVNFISCNIESNDDLGIEIVNGTNINFIGAYGENGGSTSARWINIGSGTSSPRNINLTGCYIQSITPKPDYHIVINCVSGLLVSSCCFAGTNGQVINNVGTSVNNIMLMCNWYGSDGTTTLINDTEGVVSATYRDDTFYIPTMFAIPSGTSPTTPASENSLPEGSLFLDTDASANGSLYCYSNGAWRKVADL